MTEEKVVIRKSKFKGPRLDKIFQDRPRSISLDDSLLAKGEKKALYLKKCASSGDDLIIRRADFRFSRSSQFGRSGECLSEKNAREFNMIVDERREIDEDIRSLTEQREKRELEPAIYRCISCEALVSSHRILLCGSCNPPPSYDAVQKIKE